MVGDTVRCPWHHGCFSLRTGQPLRPPALNDLSCWDVAVSDGMVRVGAKRQPAPRPSRRAKAPESVVIVGGGAAGERAAETLRREGYEGPVTIVDPDGDAPYDRPNLSKDYLAGNAPEEWIPLHPPDFYQQQGIELRRGPRVASLDPRGRRVRLDDGTDLQLRRAAARHRGQPRASRRPTSRPARRGCTTSARWPTAAGSSVPRAKAAARSCSARASSVSRWRPRSARERWMSRSSPRTRGRWNGCSARRSAT